MSIESKRRLALQIAAQLPDDREAALEILALAAAVVRFMDAEQAPPKRRSVVQLVE